MTLRKNITQTLAVSFMAVTLVMAVTLAYIPSASADDTLCGDTAGRETISTGTLANVIVPSPSDGVSGECMLNKSVVVQGDVKVEEGGKLLIRVSAQVKGNVQADKAAFIDISGKDGSNLIEIGGSIQIKGTTGSTEIRWADVGGSIQVEEQASAGSGPILVNNNDVGGDVQLNKNNAKNNIHVSNTDIGGNLQCAENDPNPTTSGNDVAGDEDCSD